MNNFLFKRKILIQLNLSNEKMKSNIVFLLYLFLHFFHAIFIVLFKDNSIRYDDTIRKLIVPFVTSSTY